jgi:hypothetical protein
VTTIPKCCEMTIHVTRGCKGQALVSAQGASWPCRCVINLSADAADSSPTDVGSALLDTPAARIGRCADTEAAHNIGSGRIERDFAFILASAINYQPNGQGGQNEDVKVANWTLCGSGDHDADC